MDRLSRNAAFLLALRDAHVDFVASDLPEVNTMTLGVMALVAQHEAEMISKRTKDALRAAKARGKVLGGKRKGAADIRAYQRSGSDAAQACLAVALSDVAPEIKLQHSAGGSLSELARRLNQEGIRALRGGKWTAKSIGRALVKLGLRP
ncbi:MAG: recombinase family protein [Alphaproteobacteria bacterium]